MTSPEPVSDGPSWIPDVLLTVVLTVVVAGGTIAVNGLHGFHGGPGGSRTAAQWSGVNWLALALALVSAAVLVARRHFPSLTLGVCGAAVALYLALGYAEGPVIFALILAVYAAARYDRIQLSARVAAATVVVLLVHLVTSDVQPSGWVGVLPTTAWVAVPYAVGIVVRTRIDARRQSRAALIRERVDDERLRVAREVHDVVGHGLAAIKMQADIALHVAPQDPDQAVRALRTISDSSARALDELRATLAMVRQGEAQARTPTGGPGLADISGMCERMARSGIQVRYAVHGSPRSASATTELVAYRVVQESLTNVLKHGDGGPATVDLYYRDQDLRLLIRSGVPQRRSAGGDYGSGQGLAGLRARVERIGGTLSAGLTGPHEFTVDAVLPEVHQ